MHPSERQHGLEEDDEGQRSDDGHADDCHHQESRTVHCRPEDRAPARQDQRYVMSIGVMRPFSAWASITSDTRFPGAKHTPAPTRIWSVKIP